MKRTKLFPTDLGMVVNDFLVKFFPSILNYKFTAKVEELSMRLLRAERMAVDDFQFLRRF
ncbi:MAG: hypothetical protein R3B93_27765 [Bacteroidia bacterium]